MKNINIIISPSTDKGNNNAVRINNKFATNSGTFGLQAYQCSMTSKPFKSFLVLHHDVTQKDLINWVFIFPIPKIIIRIWGGPGDSSINGRIINITTCFVM